MSEVLTQPTLPSEAPVAALVASPADATALPATPKRRTRRTTAAVRSNTASGMSLAEAPTHKLPGIAQWTRMAKRALQWLKQRRQWPVRSRRMHLCETVSLGEKRFLAIVNVDGQQFLVGGAAASVCLLTQLSQSDNFATTLHKRQRSRRTKA